MTTPFSFIQITDLHLGWESATLEYFQEDLRQIDSEVGDRASFIAVTGDLTAHGTEEEMLIYLEGIKSSHHQLYPVIGNHDYDNGRGKDRKKDAAPYQKLISPLNYSFDFNGVHFVSYDCIDYLNEPSLGGETCARSRNDEKPSDWLVQDLSTQPKEKPIVLLIHYQLGNQFYDQLKDFNIVATISGHWHSSRLFHDGRIAHFNGPSLCFGGIDYSPRAYRLFTWTGKELLCETIPLRRPQRLVTESAANNASRLKEVWRSPLNAEALLGSPVLHNDHIFMGLMNEDAFRDGAVACWDASSGREIWRTRLGASVKNTVAVHGDQVAAVTVTGEVVALDVANGNMVWNYQLGDPSMRWIFSSPLALDGHIYVGQGSHFAALDSKTGKPKWVRTDLSKDDWISSFISPVTDGEHVFIDFFWKTASFYALEKSTGATFWKTGSGAASCNVTTPTHDGHDSLFVIGHDGTVRKLTSKTANVLWESKIEDGWSPARPCYDGEFVFVASAAGKLFAFHAETGETKWIWESGEDLSHMHAYFRAAKTLLCSPQVFGEDLLFGTNDGRLVALHRKTGVLSWEHNFGVPITSIPAVSGNKIYVAARDHCLYAFDFA
jgi:outer membrane protein assembly factor BamB